MGVVLLFGPGSGQRKSVVHGESAMRLPHTLESASGSAAPQIDVVESDLPLVFHVVGLLVLPC